MKCLIYRNESDIINVIISILISIINQRALLLVNIVSCIVQALWDLINHSSDEWLNMVTSCMTINSYVSDPPKSVHFGGSNTNMTPIFLESEQHKLIMMVTEWQRNNKETFQSKKRRRKPSSAPASLEQEQVRRSYSSALTCSCNNDSAAKISPKNHLLLERTVSFCPLFGALHIVK